VNDVLNRGQDTLNLRGKDLLIYQTGEVTRFAVEVESSVGEFIRQAQQAWHLQNEKWKVVPRHWGERYTRAKERIQMLPIHHPDDRPAELKAAMIASLDRAHDAMNRRHRIVHDEWQAHENMPGEYVRWGHIPGMGVDVQDNPPPGPGVRSVEDFHQIAVDLRRATLSLPYLRFLIPMPPDQKTHFPWIGPAIAILQDRFDLEDEGIRVHGYENGPDTPDQSAESPEESQSSTNPGHT
jgi:hypothetical protein